MSWLSVWICSDLRTLVRDGGVEGVERRRQGTENGVCFVSSLKNQDLLPHQERKRRKKFSYWCPRESNSDQNQEAFKPPVQLFSFDANKESANINVMCALCESVIKQFRHNWKLQFTGCSKVDWWNTDTLFQDVLHKKQLRLARNPKSQFWAYLTFTKCWINKLIWIILQQNDAFYCLICPRGFSLDFLDLNPK